MNLSDIISAIQSSTLTQINSPIKLQWGSQDKALGASLLPQRIDIREGMFTGIEGHITCLSTRSDLPLNAFIGMPISVQTVTDLGNLHAVNGLVTDVRSGESDGSLASYQITMRDALSVMDARINTRVFRSQSIPDILQVMFSEWRTRSTTMASAFDFDLSGLTADNHPKREYTQQINESDAHFVQRLCRREGISWYISAGKRGSNATSAAADDSPVHTLVLFDNNAGLKQSATGAVRYHRDAATEERDSITQFSLSQKLIPGFIDNATWDSKDVRMSRVQSPTTVDQGPTGNDLAKLLANRLWDAPHAADTNTHFTRQTDAQMGALEFNAMLASGKGGVRDLTVGTWFQLVGHPDLSILDVTKQTFVLTSLHHKGENNLPKELNEKAQALFKATGWTAPLIGDSGKNTSTALSSSDSVQTRYENHFTAVQRDVPIRPSFDPAQHLPRVYPLTALVVGPPGEEVHTDSMGRIKVQIQGLDSADHAHANGAGTTGTDVDSAWVRVSGSLSGGRYGNSPLPRVGTEVVVDFLNGDPDKMFIAGVMANGRDLPAAFTHVGSLPGNRYVTGTKTKEISGQRYNQLRFDDTPEQISTQLASEHAHSQLNMGFLMHPRKDGVGEARGEGAELRTDAAAAVRAAQGILLTTYARAHASGGHIDRDELTALLATCTDLFKSLGDYAGQHGGQAADTIGQSNLYSAVSNWTSKVDAQSEDAQTSAIIAVGAASGNVSVTPKTHLTYAGENIDHVAQKNIQMTSGQKTNITAATGVNLFANGGGISVLANQGKVTIQAQQHEMELASEQALRLASNNGEVTVTGKTIKLISDDGSYILLDNSGVTIGTKMEIFFKSSGHVFEGPNHLSRDMNTWSTAPYDQKVRMVNRDGTPAANQRYEIHRGDGAIISGVTDSNGGIPVQQGVKLEGAMIIWKGRA